MLITIICGYYVLLLCAESCAIRIYLTAKEMPNHIIPFGIVSVALLFAAVGPVVVFLLAFRTEDALVSRAKAETMQIAWIISQYLNTNGKWPTRSDTDLEYASDSMEFRNVLSASKVSFEIPKGGFMDPWGQPYRVVVDSDGDGKCKIGPLGSVVATNCVVWTMRQKTISSWIP